MTHNYHWKFNFLRTPYWATARGRELEGCRLSPAASISRWLARCTNLYRLLSTGRSKQTPHWRIISVPLIQNIDYKSQLVYYWVTAVFVYPFSTFHSCIQSKPLYRNFVSIKIIGRVLHQVWNSICVSNFTIFTIYQSHIILHTTAYTSPAGRASGDGWAKLDVIIMVCGESLETSAGGRSLWKRTLAVGFNQLTSRLWSSTHPLRHWLPYQSKVSFIFAKNGAQKWKHDGINQVTNYQSSYGFKILIINI